MDKIYKPVCPMVVSDIAKMGITGQQIPIDNAIIGTIDTCTALYLIGVANARVEVYQARIVKFMCWYFNFWSRRIPWPKAVFSFCQTYITTPNRSILHHNICTYDANHLRSLAAPRRI